MKRRQGALGRAPALLLAALLAAAGVAQAAGAADAVVVTGPAGAMTRAELEAMVSDLVPPAERARFWADAGAVARFARSLYAQRVLAGDALKAGLDSTPEGVAYLKPLRERGLAELLLRQREQAEVPDAKVVEGYARSEYRAKPERFQQPEQVQARHILLPVAKDGKNEAEVKARAEQLMGQLRGGADFAKLAREHSADKASAARGGDLGEFARGRMVPEFEEALFALKKPGEQAGPVRTQFGYHLIELTGRKPAQMKTFEQVLPELRQELVSKIKANERTAVWDAAQGQAKVDDAALQALVGAHAPAASQPSKP